MICSAVQGPVKISSSGLEDIYKSEEDTGTKSRI